MDDPNYVLDLNSIGVEDYVSVRYEHDSVVTDTVGYDVNVYIVGGDLFSITMLDNGGMDKAWRTQAYAIYNAGSLYAIDPPSTTVDCCVSISTATWYKVTILFDVAAQISTVGIIPECTPFVNPACGIYIWLMAGRMRKIQVPMDSRTESRNRHAQLSMGG